ncbi:HXXEE domain-containing protein [Noviherbaspirillum aridicola]|uniref:HXXEE domain-containing protein n=1 Tax=Noviherbaspirillum aridicola TaxID=2849687 RepID=A0ABQ4QAW0_9BURK|nr:HXXEE domain-containing protein [Noviherbaspirillum aridicola]GIZ54141.1 hypothetical protein NCCP691_41550 [Noviherbaspirillum aridicola]
MIDSTSPGLKREKRGRTFLIPWPGPAIFLIHDTEEILTVEQWTILNMDRLPEFVRSFLPVRTLEFGIGVALILASYLAICLLDHRRLKHGATPLWSLWATSLLLANALTHTVQTVWYGNYTPGIVTAALVVLPYGTAVMRLALKEHWIRSHASLQRMLLLSLFAQAPLAALSLFLGRQLSMLVPTG